MTLQICPCGIARVDCDYHKPETKEAVPDTLRDTPKSSPFIHTSGEWVTYRFGTWSSTLTFTEEEIRKQNCLNDVAKRVAGWHHRIQMEMLVGAFGSDVS